ncbi:MAG: YafY family protein [Imperialibacter sp.]|uniref:helix-turn-helix transcriptional regulator n=1 Tax=Imperialibacter sp. TaxID=2038411 RepID=UPI0032EEE367
MAEDKPRLARLTAILTQLQSKQLVTATDIAKKHQVSIRTVYRDIRTLEKSGIPIVTQEGRGYSIMEGFKLPPVMFTEEEASAIVIAEKLIRANKDRSLVEHYESAATKIRSILKFGLKTKTELLSDRLQVRDNSENKKTSNHLIQLQSAISNYQVIEINYLSLENQQSQRKIEPFALYTTQGNWILIAFCQLKNGFRAFRLDRIQSLLQTDSHFQPHKITLEQYFEECRKKWSATPDTPLAQGPSTFASNQNI